MRTDAQSAACTRHETHRRLFLRRRPVLAGTCSFPDMRSVCKVVV
jgi:hypothetical protein